VVHFEHTETMTEVNADLKVVLQEDRWVVIDPSGQRATYPTQQAAIDAAKRAALECGLDVAWSDRDGRPQGRARYRLSGMA
jgi:hypothetical protein